MRPPWKAFSASSTPSIWAWESHLNDHGRCDRGSDSHLLPLGWLDDMSLEKMVSSDRQNHARGKR